MALTANRTNLVTQPGNGAAPESYIVANAEQIYAGALVGVNSAGYLVNWADTAGFVFKGLAIGGTPSVNGAGSNESSVLGNTSATRPPEMTVDVSGVTLKKQAVANETLMTAVGEEFAATDEDTLTNVAPTNVKEIGTIRRFHSATEFDCKLYTPGEYMAHA